jgi:RNA polymerase sigma factor (sigma-70 family)
MGVRRLDDVLRRVRQQLSVPRDFDCSDRQLLDRFVHLHDQSAFTCLVRRHGSLVFGVARRILRDNEEAQDVFQATFLILARKSRSVAWSKSAAGWLHRVAYRLALRTLQQIIRRKEMERQAGFAVRTAEPEYGFSEHRAALDEELHRLADRYRAPLALCYLEGKTRDQAANELGWSLRTLERRLQQGLKLLRLRLSKRGVDFAVAMIAAGISQQEATAMAKPSVIEATVRSAKSYQTGAADPGALSPETEALAESGLRAMSASTHKSVAVLLLSAVMASVLGVWLGQVPAASQTVRSELVSEEPINSVPIEAWPEGATVKGRVLDHRGKPVPDAEVLLLGAEQVFVEADRRTWFVADHPNENPKVPSAKTNGNGEFSLKRTKGTGNRLLVIAADPLMWVVRRSSLKDGDNVTINLPQSGAITFHCNLPRKADRQPVQIESRTLADVWSNDVLRLDFSSTRMKNPGDTVIDHLPPGQYAVERYIETETAENTVQMTGADRQLVKVSRGERGLIRFERSTGQPVAGQVRGLENVALRYALVTINYLAPEEQVDANGRRARSFTAFDVIPIQSDGRFRTDPMPPGKYELFLFAVKSSTLKQSNQQSDFDGHLTFTVPDSGAMPDVQLRAKPSQHRPLPNDDLRVKVIDEDGKPLAAFEAMLYTAGRGYTHWLDGIDGLANLASKNEFPGVEMFYVALRAKDYAPIIARFDKDGRRRLAQGTASLTLRRGKKVELRFRLPQGMTWPKGLVPEVYFEEVKETARSLRQPANRDRGLTSDLNICKLTDSGNGRFNLDLAADTRPFFVAIHSPGFLRYFEAGPFTPADVKDGVLSVNVPRPATLDVHFDVATKDEAGLPFKSVSLDVMRQLEGNEYLDVANTTAGSVQHSLKLNDLSPGNYQVSGVTHADASGKSVRVQGLDRSSYFDRQNITLREGSSEKATFQYEPFSPDCYRGKRTAVLRFLISEHAVLSDRTVTVSYQASHYGRLPVFKGTLPRSGEITLKELTDQIPSFIPRNMAYTVQVGDRQLGSFCFKDAEGIETFEFRLPQQAGDRAPDIDLISVATGKPIRLSSLRGKVICLEFWATWCGPCQPAMEKLDGMSDELKAAWKERLAIVPLSIDTKTERVKSHTVQRGWTHLDYYWTGIGEDVGFDAPAARAFVVQSVPETILIGRDGNIVWRGHPLTVSVDGDLDLRKRIEAELKK